MKRFIMFTCLAVLFFSLFVAFAGGADALALEGQTLFIDNAAALVPQSLREKAEAFIGQCPGLPSALILLAVSAEEPGACYEVFEPVQEEIKEFREKTELLLKTIEEEILVAEAAAEEYAKSLHQTAMYSNGGAQNVAYVADEMGRIRYLAMKAILANMEDELSVRTSIAKSKREFQKLVDAVPKLPFDSGDETMEESLDYETIGYIHMQRDYECNYVWREYIRKVHSRIKAKLLDYAVKTDELSLQLMMAPAHEALKIAKEYVNAALELLSLPSEDMPEDLKVEIEDMKEEIRLIKKRYGYKVYRIALDKTSYVPGEAITVEVSGVLGNINEDRPFVGVYATGGEHGKYLSRENVSKGNGNYRVDAPIEPGEYEVRAYEKRNVYTDDNLIMKAEFTVAGR
ncbi:MAG: hypothetical protein FWF87_01370 [Synergistaceae bacterium]|nr:hypothetical protein [Synergistaceae bacterium]